MRRARYPGTTEADSVDRQFLLIFSSFFSFCAISPAVFFSLFSVLLFLEQLLCIHLRYFYCRLTIFVSPNYVGIAILKLSPSSNLYLLLLLYTLRDLGTEITFIMNIIETANICLVLEITLHAINAYSN